MKQIIIILFFITSFFCEGQIIFSHEKEISNPQNYNIRSINFYNNVAKIILSGTLIEPKKSFKRLVIIVPGSGKDTRNSHYKLTEELLKSNIAVYRFDERGVGNSQGNFTSSVEGLADDLYFAIQKLSLEDNLKNKKIGVLGHSLGGMASVIVSTFNNSVTNKIDFLVQIASPTNNFADASKYQITTLPLYQVSNIKNKKLIALLEQLVFITKENKTLSNEIIREKGINIIKERGFSINQIKFWSNAHIELFKHDYVNNYKSLTIPTMYVIGSKDKFINPIEETKRLEKINNPNITITVIDNLNHYLTKGGLNDDILYDIDVKATDSIIDWIQKN